MKCCTLFHYIARACYMCTWLHRFTTRGQQLHSLPTVLLSPKSGEWWFTKFLKNIRNSLPMRQILIKFARHFQFYNLHNTIYQFLQAPIPFIPRFLLQPQGLYPDKYEWAGHNERGDCSLKILYVQLDDDGFWQCQVTASSYASKDALTSKPVRLLVRGTLISQSNPSTCSINSSLN